MKRRTVVLAAGFFPRAGSAARQALESARRVVCCDGAADAFKRRLGREPDVVVGDFDSVRGRFRTAECVRVAEQETNDLDKALALCRARGWTDPLVVGATGRREDHTLGNVFRALDAGVEVLTETGRFLPVRDRATLRVAPGTAVSVFAPDRRTRMTSRGLVWPLDDVRFGSLYCATLNRASSARVEVTTTHPVSVYVAF